MSTHRGIIQLQVAIELLKSLSCVLNAIIYTLKSLIVIRPSNRENVSYKSKHFPRRLHDHLVTTKVSSFSSQNSR